MPNNKISWRGLSQQGFFSEGLIHISIVCVRITMMVWSTEVLEGARRLSYVTVSPWWTKTRLPWNIRLRRFLMRSRISFELTISGKRQCYERAALSLGYSNRRKSEKDRINLSSGALSFISRMTWHAFREKTPKDCGFCSEVAPSINATASFAVRMEIAMIVEI